MFVDVIETNGLKKTQKMNIIEIKRKIQNSERKKKNEKTPLRKLKKKMYNSSLNSPSFFLHVPITTRAAL